MVLEMNDALYRYSRQIAFTPFGRDSQIKLMKSRALIIGMGGLGSWTAELLVRAGVGYLRIADDDCVDISNIHRQALYDQADAEQGRLKVVCAAEHLSKINSDCTIDSLPERIDKFSIGSAAKGIDLIIDGTDNFGIRYLINDFAVKKSVPWIFAGVLKGEGQVMTIIPHKTPCLRCVMPSPPVCRQENCISEGVLGAAVAVIAALQCVEAIKILTGNSERSSPCLVKYDVWNNIFQRLDVSGLRKKDCPCCGRGDFEFLES